MLGYLVLVILHPVLVVQRQKTKNISDKHVYIKGCDSGFGNVPALERFQQGFHVLALCFIEKGAQELKNRTSSRLKTFQLDVTNSESIGKAAEFVKSEVKGKGLWGLVNNVEIALPSGPCEWLTIDDYKVVLNVNLIGLNEVTLSVIPLIKRAQGRIVNMSSIFGRLIVTGRSYSISKFVVEAFNDIVRTGLKYFGVQVACIEPSFFKMTITNFDLVTGQVTNLWDRLPRDIQEEYGADDLDNMFAEMRKIMRNLDPDLMKVVWCMNHAHPCTRYSVGRSAKLFWITFSYMPTTNSDFVLGMNDTKPAKAVF